jgi:hypothetical protein
MECLQFPPGSEVFNRIFFIPLEFPLFPFPKTDRHPSTDKNTRQSHPGVGFRAEHSRYSSHPPPAWPAVRPPPSPLHRAHAPSASLIFTLPSPHRNRGRGSRASEQARSLLARDCGHRLSAEKQQQAAAAAAATHNSSALLQQARNSSSSTQQQQ